MYHNERQYEGLTNVWLTPLDLLLRLGPFDLDPCAADPRPFDIGTKLNWTEADDGLSREWPRDHFAFVNPPYGPHVGKWMRKLAEHHYGIGLLFARTETWPAQEALAQCDAVMFPKGRIRFLRGAPPHEPGVFTSGAPSMLVAFGAMAVARLARLDGWYGCKFKPWPTEDD